MGECKCVCEWILSGLQITYGRVQVYVCVDLVWVADKVWESASVCVCVCVCVALVWGADNVWESASGCVWGFGLGC